MEENIELRSEKIRHIIGKVPPGIVRYGIIVITVVVVALFLAAYFIPYPETVNGKVIASGAEKSRIFIPYRYLNKVKDNMKVNVEFEGYDADSYGYQRGTVILISKTPVAVNEINTFVVTVYFKTPTYKIVKGMTGTATLFLTEESVLKRIVGKLIGGKS